MRRQSTGELPGTLIRQEYRTGIQRLPRAFAALEVPIVAAVNGPAIGAGCDLACMCDIRVAGESAKFAESFVKLGIIPGDGGACLVFGAGTDGGAGQAGAGWWPPPVTKRGGSG